MRTFSLVLAMLLPGSGVFAFECTGVKLPSSLVICSDAELMRLADERQEALNQAMSLLNGQQQKELLADQNGWVRSYATACGIPPDSTPPDPVPDSVKACFRRAGQARIAYLRNYGVGAPSAAQATAPAPPIQITSRAYAEGLADREAWERYLDGLSGQTREGAEYWAAHRSVRGSSCQPAAAEQQGQWQSGCLSAKRQLDPTDKRRLSEPDYRQGWNAYVEPTSKPVGSRSASPSPAATTGPSATSPQASAPPNTRNSNETAEVNKPPPTTKKPDTELPDRTPRGMPVEKEAFYVRYRAGLVENIDALLRLTDVAVDMAHADGLSCDSVTVLDPWMFSKGWTLQCNHFDYKYYIEDKGRGWQIRIAD